MATATEKLLTAEEFARLPEPSDGAKQELVRGEIIVMPPPGYRHGDCQAQICFLLKQWAFATRLGRVTVESGIVTESDPDSVRGPDVAYWSFDRIPADQRPKGYPDVAADLCVEVLSPNDRRVAVMEKVREYIARGVRLVWVVDPEVRTVTVYRDSDEPTVLHEQAILTGEDVLPGFTCQVSEVFS